MTAKPAPAAYQTDFIPELIAFPFLTRLCICPSNLPNLPICGTAELLHQADNLFAKPPL
ncbi:MAG: hypothetical protein HC827_11175 [Cyanobacteria bacterium RM1_2_2]|nr:hypothetical protein [Cyanobacteria bacterium RM1_2_2]